MLRVTGVTASADARPVAKTAGAEAGAPVGGEGVGTVGAGVGLGRPGDGRDLDRRDLGQAEGGCEFLLRHMPLSAVRDEQCPVGRASSRWRVAPTTFGDLERALYVVRTALYVGSSRAHRHDAGLPRQALCCCA